MIVYLNDLSLKSVNGLVADWKKVESFYTLVDKLIATSNVTIHAPLNIWDIPIGGYDVRRNITLKGQIVPSKMGKLMAELYKKMKPVKDDGTMFSLNHTMDNPSVSVGMAVVNDRPVISIVFDDVFKTNAIDGWLKVANMAPYECSVHNLYDSSNGEAFIYLTDVKECCTKNPLDEPFWNIELAKKILENVDFVNISHEDRQGRLIYYGDLIASVNGWIKNDYLNKLNTSKDHLRYIYDSEKNFTSYAPVYISIDLESPIVSFELFDKSGRHLGEYDWQGRKVKERSSDHDIKLK